MHDSWFLPLFISSESGGSERTTVYDIKERMYSKSMLNLYKTEDNYLRKPIQFNLTSPGSFFMILFLMRSFDGR